MRIVLDGRYIQDHFPGIARYAFNLARSLGDACGDDEIVVLIDPTMPNHRYDLDQLRSANRISIRTITAPVFGLAGLFRLTAALRALRPDVYHAPYVLRSPFFTGPSVVTIFDLIAEHSGTIPTPGLLPGLRRELFHQAVGIAVRSSTRVIVPSWSTASDLADRHHGAQGKIRLIPLGVDPIFRPADSGAIAAVRERYRLPGNFILCVGINKPHKNLSGLVRAMRNPDVATVNLVSAGPIDGRFPGANRLAEEYGVADRVSELGEVPEAELPGLYSAADLLVCPSLDEGFGLTPLEAMACGTPVVSSNWSSLSEVVGDAGILVDARNEAQVAGAIRQILNSPDLAARLRAAGFRLVAQHTWGAAARATREVYREAARGR